MCIHINMTRRCYGFILERKERMLEAERDPGIKHHED